jgi:hypothetical protein
MSTDPWTSDDPQPRDFDALLATIGPDYVEHQGGDPAARLWILVSVEGESAHRLERLARARGQRPHDVVAELLRDADRPGTKP